MNDFFNLKTKTKLLLGFCLMMVISLIVIGLGYSTINKLKASQEILFERDFSSALNIAQFRSSLNRMRASFQTMVLYAGDDQGVRKWHENVKDVEKEIDALLPKIKEQLKGDAQQTAKFQEVLTLLVAYRSTRDASQIPDIYAGKSEEIKKVTLGSQNDRYNKMRELTHEMGNAEIEHAQVRLAGARTLVNSSSILFVVLGIVVIILGITLSLFFSNMIVNPLKLLTEAVNTLASAVSEILSSTTELASVSAETSASVSETTATVEEVKQAARLATEKSRNISDSAQQAALVAQQGQEAVTETVNGINLIKHHMDTVADSIIKLSERNQAIGEIINTVNDLAQQSNLLAVNAAIEAAKAGEQGKGFAVVAQEVKSLAEQSKQATVQVRSILNDIQKATGAAVMTTEQVSKAVDASVNQATESGDSISRLATSVTDAANALLQIVASSQQQMVGMDQIAMAMENIKQAAQQNMAGTKQAEQSAQSLNGLGQKLKEMVSRYKV